MKIVDLLKKIDEFFPIHDTHNCQRIYDAIISR